MYLLKKCRVIDLITDSFATFSASCGSKTPDCISYKSQIYNPNSLKICKIEGDMNTKIRDSLANKIKSNLGPQGHVPYLQKLYNTLTFCLLGQKLLWYYILM